jgi:hypothetical protein
MCPPSPHARQRTYLSWSWHVCMPRSCTLSGHLTRMHIFIDIHTCPAVGPMHTPRSCTTGADSTRTQSQEKTYLSCRALRPMHILTFVMHWGPCTSPCNSGACSSKHNLISTHIYPAVGPMPTPRRCTTGAHSTRRCCGGWGFCWRSASTKPSSIASLVPWNVS